MFIYKIYQDGMYLGNCYDLSIAYSEVRRLEKLNKHSIYQIIKHWETNPPNIIIPSNGKT